MIPACRRPIQALWGEKDQQLRTSPIAVSGSHAGLLLSSYLRVGGDDGEAKRELLQSSIDAAKRAGDVYAGVFERWRRYIQEGAGDTLADNTLDVHGRVIVGLGGENVLETGITLHHTYGTPLLPGSALKGLASHYCDQVWGRQDAEFKSGGKYHQTIFGTTDDSGHIVFYDAWIEPASLQGDDSGLVLDVMTPHHGSYYMAAADDNTTAPTDFDNPNPVSFLSVTGSFYAAVSCDVAGEVGKKWADLSLALLHQALEHWGIGGKTNAGYGRLVDRSKSSHVSQSEEVVEEAVPTPVKPQFKVNDEIQATRVEDPKDRGRAWFEAPDGFSGAVSRGNPPDIKKGETTTLWIASVSGNTYNFSADPPRPQKKGKGKPPRRNR